MSALLSVRNLGVEYRDGGRHLRALEGIDLSVEAGEAVGIVGESGSGKSTLARVILKLMAPTTGTVEWLGADMAAVAGLELARIRQHLTVVFQDPVASLDPRLAVADSIGEPLIVHAPDLDGGARTRAIDAMLERVGLDSGYGRRYPHELSGGQCQRVAIARAMITRPKLVVCDEPFSALDVSVQAQIVNLFAELGRETGTALVVISHNLALVRHLCSRVMVLYLGRIMELAPREAIFGAPLHPYTRLLLDAVPRLGRPPRSLAAGEPASPFAPPSGCVFRSRCRHAIARCAEARPPLEAKGPAQRVACFRADEGVAARPASD